MSRPALPFPASAAAVAWLTLALLSPSAAAQDPPSETASQRRLVLGFAVDTIASSRWGTDPALTALPGVVRTWRDYLLVRADPEKRTTFWSAADRERSPDPDLIVASESYIFEAHRVLLEALPLVTGDSSRWMLRTMYFQPGTAERPGLLAQERINVVREGTRWALSHPVADVTTDWARHVVGPIEYVVHPALQFNASRADATARWVDSTAQRFGLGDVAPITYYQVPHLAAAFSLMGLDWAITADRVGGRANPGARIVFAAHPCYGEAYRHELAHVLLAPLVKGRSSFTGEGMGYWLGGARGRSFPGMIRDVAGYLGRHPTMQLRAILEDRRNGDAASLRFPAAAVVFEIAYRRGGDAAVLQLIDQLGASEPTLGAIATALGMPAAELESTWQSVVRSMAAAHLSTDPCS